MLLFFLLIMEIFSQIGQAKENIYKENTMKCKFICLNTLHWSKFTIKMFFLHFFCVAACDHLILPTQSQQYLVNR